MIRSASRAADLVDIIFAFNLTHRKGHKPAEHMGPPSSLLTFLREEVDELASALRFLEAVYYSLPYRPDFVDKARSEAKKELGDVFNCVLVIAKQMGLTFEELDHQGAAKLLMRYPGLIDCPGAVPT